jgi:cytochrome b6-f complex iron-sulfur subunit
MVYRRDRTEDYWRLKVNRPENKRQLNRREFIGALWGISLAALVGQAAAALVQFLKPGLVEGGFGGKVVAGRAEEFTPGTVSLVQKGHFYISRLEDGSTLALWQRCTHLGCTVPWRQDEGQFHCPCHGSLFNTKGEVIGGPAPHPLDLFPIEVVNGNVVIVDTSSPITRDQYDPSQAVQI